MVIAMRLWGWFPFMTRNLRIGFVVGWLASHVTRLHPNRHSPGPGSRWVGRMTGARPSGLRSLDMLGEEGLGCWVAKKNPCLSFPKADKYTNRPQPHTCACSCVQDACRARTRHDRFSPRFGLLYLFNMTTFARTMIHIGRLFLLLASCGWAAVDVAGQSKLPETVEVDLVFPHNDTYAPVALMPLVFAIQNFPTSRPLFLQIDFDIFHTPSWNTTVQQGIIFLNHANYSNNGSTLHFVYDWTTRLNNTEGSWAMWWGVYSANCTDTGLAPGPLKLDLNYQRNLVHFSTKHGAQQPDLVAASKDGVCDKTTGVTFNITEVKEVSWFNRHSVDHDVCPILAPEAPKPNSCLAKVNATTASSILYDIQSKACMRGLNPNVTCPPEPQGQSAGTQTLPFSRGQISWLVLALAGLAKLV